ncbi:MAG: hypothetical protein KDJ39_07430 [Gammaproteobacteria bacterium]|nr:hypothetical protein [Gammaproteobacteria bacterium]MCP5298544.1 hypothetical protein [Chromatiaceae bacterium]
MPAIDSVTAPLVLRHADGNEQLVAACFPHPLGLLYLDLYWHRSGPEHAAHLIRGALSGDGPWRIGDARLRVLGCHNTDPHLQASFAAWQRYLREHVDEYPPRAQIVEIARRLGATPSP